MNSTLLCLGIDTEGTFTDGVLFDLQNRAVVKSTKVLTTHQGLKICVSQVLEHPLTNRSGTISFVSLYTTLATNALADAKFQEKVAAFAVSSYAGQANSKHEKRAAAIVAEITALPIGEPGLNGKAGIV